MIRKKQMLIFLASVLMMGSLQTAFIHADGSGARHSGHHVDVGFGTKVTLDGVISPGEWSDARKLRLPIGSDFGDVYIKETGTDLLIATYHSDMNMVDVYIDVNNDGGSAPRTDDLYFHSSFDDWEGKGTGSDWDLYYDPRGWEVKWDDSDYLTREFRIGYSKIGVEAGTNSTIGLGIYMMVMSDPSTPWPPGASGDEPNTWGDAFSSDLWNEGAPPNLPPALSSRNVYPPAGTSTEKFEFSVTYSDPEGDPPIERSLLVDGIEHTMSSDETTYKIGAVFMKELELSEGSHEYRFRFGDGENTIFHPAEGAFQGPDVLRPNKAPVLMPGGIPDGMYTMREGDERANNIIDLEEYFWDDRDEGELRFEIVHQEDPDILEAMVDQQYLDLYLKDEDWSGSLGFRVKAIDCGVEGLPLEKHVLETVSNIFMISVHPANDEPEIIFLGETNVQGRDSIHLAGGSAAIQGRWYNISLKVRDPDLLDGSMERLSISCSDERFIVTPLDGSVDGYGLSFLPGNGDVGCVHVSLCVEDLAGCKDTLELDLDVMNVNDPPEFDGLSFKGIDLIPVEGVIELAGPLSLEEGSTTTISLSAEDPDILIGEEDLLFFSILTDTDFLDIDPDSGTMTVKPTRKDVGTHRIDIAVNDLYGEGPGDVIGLNLEVRNKNDEPADVQILLEGPGTEFVEGSPVNLSCSFEDGDLFPGSGEFHSITWTSDLDGALGCGDRLSLCRLGPGTHLITATVTDRAGASAYRCIEVSVLEKEKEPETEIPPRIVREEDAPDPILVAGMLSVIVLCGSIWLSIPFAVLVIRRNRRKVRARGGQVSGDMSGGDLASTTAYRIPSLPLESGGSPGVRGQKFDEGGTV